MPWRFKWLFLLFTILLFGCQANHAAIDVAQGAIRRHDLVNRFGLPAGYTVDQILAPPVPEPRIARSESGLVYLGREDGKALFTLEVRTGCSQELGTVQVPKCVSGEISHGTHVTE